MTIENKYEGPKSAQELMQRNTLVKHYAGSISYGTALPDSDVDLRGIFCANPINVRTPFFPVGEATASDEEDTKLYELSHFMKLCVDCNPNIVETLWTSREDITFTTDAYELLRQHRQELLSQKIAYTTSGYAISQLRRIKNHERWVSWEEPFVELFNLLSKAFSNGDIDKTFIERECGKEVLRSMEQRNYI